MERLEDAPDPVAAESRPEQSDSQRVAELERELALWKLRAESAEAAIVGWRATQGRSLWRFLVAFDRIRTRLAPPRTRRDRFARAAAFRLSTALIRVGRDLPPPPKERFTPTGRKAMLFVFDDLGGICTRYRCDHQAEEMAYLGASHDIAHSAEIDLVAAVDHYESFFLSRVAWSDEVEAFFEEARRRRKPVLFDTDDLVFEPDLNRHFAFLDGATEEERAVWITKLGAYRRTLEAADGVVVTTETLRRFASQRNDRVEVVFNAVSEELLRLADEASGAGSRAVGGYAGADVTIAYLSGTPTHDRDFLEAADAVLWALENYPNTRLLIVGKLKLDARFDRFESRVTRIRKQPWQAVPGILSQVDINLAPLERDNPFTESKSCLKYLEAALLGVPTVASRRDDFARAIDHGRNGFLADNRHEWREGLRLLIESKDLRRHVGLAASADLRHSHTTKARARLLEQALLRLAADDNERRLNVNWLLGGSARTNGSSPDMRELAEFLAGAGHDVRVYTDPGAHLRPADVSIATDARTAHVVAAHDRSLFKWYLISAAEGDEPSYNLPLRHICHGQDAADRLFAVTGRPTDHIETPRQLEQLLQKACLVTMRCADR